MSIHINLNNEQRVIMKMLVNRVLAELILFLYLAL